MQFVALKKVDVGGIFLWMSSDLIWGSRKQKKLDIMAQIYWKIIVVESGLIWVTQQTSWFKEKNYLYLSKHFYLYLLKKNNFFE